MRDVDLFQQRASSDGQAAQHASHQTKLMNWFNPRMILISPHAAWRRNSNLCC